MPRNVDILSGKIHTKHLSGKLVPPVPATAPLAHFQQCWFGCLCKCHTPVANFLTVDGFGAGSSPSSRSPNQHAKASSHCNKISAQDTDVGECPAERPTSIRIPRYPETPTMILESGPWATPATRGQAPPAVEDRESSSPTAPLDPECVGDW